MPPLLKFLLHSIVSLSLLFITATSLNGQELPFCSQFIPLTRCDLASSASQCGPGANFCFQQAMEGGTAGTRCCCTAGTTDCQPLTTSEPITPTPSLPPTPPTTDLPACQPGFYGWPYGCQSASLTSCSPQYQCQLQADPAPPTAFCCDPNVAPTTPTTPTIPFTPAYTPFTPTSLLNSVQDPHPLRPNPNNPIKDDLSIKTKSDPRLTLYCAQRPTAVQPVGRTDLQAGQKTTLTISGTLFSDLQYFVAPLLSITDDRKQDYIDYFNQDLTYQDLAQRYLADYLEGRAYYETFAEDPADPEFLKANQLLGLSTDFWPAFIPSRVGVFRKLASQITQDQLKYDLINRAFENFSEDNSHYSFIPASSTVHNYIVAYWKGSRVVGKDKGAKIKLKDFTDDRRKPLPEQFPSTPEGKTAWLDAVTDWEKLDNGKWAQLWPYVPMFTREDTQGFIEVIPESGPSFTKDVTHPHLARSYEVTSAISFMLAPKSTHNQNPSDPSLGSSWINPPPWERANEQPWWFDSDENKPGNWDSLGSVCDPKNTIVAGSGDLAHENTISTNFSQSEEITIPANDPCITWQRIEDPPGSGRYTRVRDYSQCKLRYSPIYLKTYTPFLHTIMDRLISGPTATFNLFQFHQLTPEPENWPAAANPYEESPQYSFSPGSAEAGYKKSPKGNFYYKYLGYIHCQKEKILATLQPYITGQPYTSFSPECGLGWPTGQPGQPGGPGPIGPPPDIPYASTCTGGITPVGRWLKFPYNVPVYNAHITSCYKEKRGSSCHGGLDMDPGDDVGIYAAAPGKVHYANYHPAGCKEYGACVIVDHCNGLFTIYGHLQSGSAAQLVEVGQEVTTATKLGIQDDTGQSSAQHLHFGLSYGGKRTDFYQSSGLTIDVCAATQSCTCTATTKYCP